MAVFEQRLADTLRDTAMDLAVNDERVHRAPDIVDGGVGNKRHGAGLWIDFDLADMRAVRVARLDYGLVASCHERPAQIIRQIAVLHCGARDLE